MATTGPHVRPRSSEPFVPPHDFSLWHRFDGIASSRTRCSARLLSPVRPFGLGVRGPANSSDVVALASALIGTGGGESGTLKLIVAASVGGVPSFGAAGTFSGRGRLQATVGSKESVRSKRWPVSKW